jgi:hypothetical protein
MFSHEPLAGPASITAVPPRKPDPLCCDPTSTTARLHFRLFLCRESLCNWQVDRWKGCGEFKEDEEIRECREEEGRQQPQRVERRLGR